MRIYKNVTSEFVHPQSHFIARACSAFRFGEANLNTVCGRFINSKADRNSNESKVEHGLGR